MPDSAADLVVLHSSASLSASEIFHLMTASYATEWADKVGVAGALDGSAKHSTRLLASQGWVLKTNLADAVETLEQAHLATSVALQLAKRSSFWHPSKHWFAFFWQGRWYPATVCRELRTLRGLEDREQRFERWIAMFSLSVDVALAHGIGLDINPSNFAEECHDDAHQWRLYYVDDEYYDAPSIPAFGEALVGRIPEEVESETSCWEELGERLQPVFDRICRDRGDWEGLLDAVARYPLVERFEEHRRALAAGLRRGHRLLDPSVRSRARARTALTCVFADVHGNLPALEAVLRAASEAGVDDYLFLGDVVGYGPHPKACVERLAELSRATLIRGNHDHALGHRQVAEGMNSLARISAGWTIEQLGRAEMDWLAGLPVEHRADDWLAVHGAPRDPRRFFAYVYDMTYQENLEVLDRSQCRLCFYGHTHVAFVHRRVGMQPDERLGARSVKVLRPRETVLVNPGAVGQPRDGDSRAAFALWDRNLDEISFHRVGYPIERTVQDLLATGLPSELANRLEVGR